MHHEPEPLNAPIPIDATFVADALSELIAAQQEALGIVTAALCQQLDPQRLKADIAGILSASAARAPFHPVAVRLAEGAMAAADAQMRLAQPTGT